MAEDISRVAKRLELEVSQTLFHPTTRGYVYVECRNQKELERILELIPSQKGLVGEIPPAQIEELFKAKHSLDEIKIYERAVVAQGPEKGSEGVVEKIENGEAVLMLDDPIMPRRITVGLGRLERKE